MEIKKEINNIHDKSYKDFFSNSKIFVDLISNFIDTIGYKSEIIDGEIKLSNHDRYEWVTLEEINNYKIAPADIPLIEKLK